MEAEKRKVINILYEDNVGQMAKYLSEGGNPNFSINGEETPLCMAKSVEMGKLLVDAGADIHYRGYRNMTPLLWQAGSSRPNMLAYLLSLDPNLIRDLESSGETALHRCVRHAYEESLKCAEVLLAANPPVDINAKTNKGYTALDLAVESRNVATERIIKLLADHGAVRSDTKPSRYNAFIKEYKARKKIGKFMINVKSKRNTLESAWQPGGEAYEALKSKVTRNGNFANTRKSRKSRKTRKSARK
jgi:ankyrin repeat protein